MNGGEVEMLHANFYNSLSNSKKHDLVGQLTQLIH